VADNDKTEKPTHKRLRDARRRGQVIRSRDLAIAIALVAVTIALGRFAPAMAEQLGHRLVAGINTAGDRARVPLTSSDIGLLVRADGWLFLMIVGPLIGVGAAAGLAGNVVQSGWNFAPEALHLNWQRLSPAQGFAKLKPSQSGIEMGKAVVAIGVLGTIAYALVDDLMSNGATLALMPPADAAITGWTRLMRLMWQSGLALLAIAGFDYGVQRWRTMSSLKMTKQEVKDEFKMQEGNPQMKARVRRMQRDMTRRRMLKAVQTATVVVTNPTHYAVALQYDRTRMVAPVIVAKGADHIAARIRKVARDHDVPIVENVPLAQGLYKGAEVGDTIPAALFGAVAEVLAYLVRIKQLML
jgi:flagellar biosynthetic protein FlhB